MDVRKYQSAINMVALFILTVEKGFENWTIVEALFMNVKRAFDYFFCRQLAQKVSDLSIDDDLIGWRLLCPMDK